MGRNRIIENEKPVLLLAETGLIIRSLLLGTFAEEVVKHRPLVVAVPNPRDPRLREILADKPIRLIPFPDLPDHGPLTHWKKLALWQTYMYRFRQAEKNTKSLEIQTRLFESDHSWIGKTAIGGLIGVGHLIKRTGLMGYVENQYLNHIADWPLTKQWQTTLHELQPSVLVSTMLTHSLLYHVSCDLPPVIAARNLGIPAGTLVQSWDNLSSKTSVLPPGLDSYWAWSETMKQELLAMNPRISTDKISIVGSPQFDFHKDPSILEPREAYLKKTGLDPKRPYVLIGTGTRVWFPSEPENTLAIAEVLKKKMPSCQVLIRLHPKDDFLRWKDFAARLKSAEAVFQLTAPESHMDSGGFIPPKDFYRDQINALTHAAVVLNTASTLTVDAAILDRPVICIAFNEVLDTKFPEGRALAFSRSTHYSHLTATGGVKVVYSAVECIQAIQDYLKNPDLDREGRKKIAEIVAGKIDGQAGARLAQDVLKMAEKKFVVEPAVC